MHERHSGIENPQALAQGDNSPGVLEAHLRNSFINCHSPLIAAMLKQQCVLWETANITKLEQYVVHVQKILNEKDKKKHENRVCDQHNATLTMFQGYTPGPSRGRGGGRGQGRGTNKGGRMMSDKAFFRCGSKEKHLSKTAHIWQREDNSLQSQIRQLRWTDGQRPDKRLRWRKICASHPHL